MRIVVATLITLLAVSPALATPVINVGNVILIPNLAGQEFQISVSGEATDLVQGMDLYLQIADSGPEGVPLGFTTIGIDGPAITNLDLVTGTIFADNYDTEPLGLVEDVVIPQLAEGGIATMMESVDLAVANGLLATVTIDTTGFDTPRQAWDLKLTNVVDGPISTGLVGENGDGYIATDITDGQIVTAAFGDTNLDGMVSIMDIFKIKISPKGFGTGATDAAWADGDMGGVGLGTPRDGIVNIWDIFAIKSGGQFGAGPYAATDGGDISAAAVPEPSTIVLLASGLLGLLTMTIRRRRSA